METLSSREVYANPWIRVREDQVINPGGGENLYGVVEFANLAVGVIPLDDEDHTWLVGQYRYSTDGYSWEIPMGGGPQDTDPVESARRELAEETGLRANTFTRLLSVEISNSVTDELGVVYLATGLTPGEPDPDETEALTVQRLPLADAVNMAMNGEITDVLSVAGLLKLARLREGGLTR